MSYPVPALALKALPVLFFALCAAAAVVDIRTRRLPHALWLALTASAALLGLVASGPLVLARHACAGVLMASVLVAFECIWRARHEGASGIGMGDVKALFALALLEPVLALVSFALGLLALGVFGIAARRRTLPALPFILGAFALVVGGLWTLSA